MLADGQRRTEISPSVLVFPRLAVIDLLTSLTAKAPDSRQECRMFDVDHKQPYIFRVEGLLTPDECAALIAKIDSLGPEVATINTRFGAAVRTDVRNNDRVIFDDEELARTLLDRVRARVPTEIHGMSFVGVNERFRCYRYKPGMRFAPHKDGAFFRNDAEQSCYSFLVYLNEEFEGGNTTFATTPEISIKPKTGIGLLFQHPIIHEGSVVTAGVKYVARTDLMYRKDLSHTS
jgi:prolyl 4-hydroxylase